MGVLLGSWGLSGCWSEDSVCQTIEETSEGPLLLPGRGDGAGGKNWLILFPWGLRQSVPCAWVGHRDPRLECDTRVGASGRRRRLSRLPAESFCSAGSRICVKSVCGGGWGGGKSNVGKGTWSGGTGGWARSTRAPMGPADHHSPSRHPLPAKSPPLGPGLAGLRAERLQAGGQQSSSFRVVTGLRKGAQGPGRGADPVGEREVGVSGGLGPLRAGMGPRQGSHVRCTDSVILGPLPGDHASVSSGPVGAAQLSSGTALGLESGQGLSSSCCCRKVTPAPQHIAPPVQALHAACSVLWKAQGPVQA